MLKYLRITVTALSLTASVLLSGLWARSYYRGDTLTGSLIGTDGFYLNSERGALYLATYTGGEDWGAWDLHTYEVEGVGKGWSNSAWTIGRAQSNTISYVGFPHWLTVLLAASVAVAPWLKWPSRFRLRTLLIATTLVAAVLGIVVVFT